VFSALAMAPGAVAQKRPNILLILADDMGYSDISPYGGEIFTPNIARLADQGMMLTNFHVSAYCAPTRGMLLTGVDNHVIGLGNMVELMAENQVGKPGYEGHLNGRAPTLATTLKSAGYHTYMAGKWHLGKTPETIPAGQGFDQSVGVLEGGADNWEAKTYSPGYASVNFFENRQALKLPDDFYSSRFYAERMIGYIDRNKGDGRPFFGYMAFQAVHQPHQAPAEFIERYTTTYQAGWSKISTYRYMRQVEMGIALPGLSLQRPPIVEAWESLPAVDQRMNAKRMAVYAGMLEYMDLSIGHVLEYLRRNDMLDNTVVVFLSDNGGEAARLQPMFPEYYAKNFDLSHERMGLKGSYAEYGPGWAATSMTPFSNFKGSAAEGGVRAPFIIRYPAQVARGGRSGAFGHVLDVVPTLLEYAGVGTGASGSAPLGGASMAQVLTGAANAVVHPPTRPIGYEVAGSAALYLGDHKLVRNAPPYGDSVWRLYNLKDDPTETRDLSASQPALKTRMMADYDAYVKQHGVVEVPAGYDVIKQGQANATKKGP